jgi:hypothetical protein
MYDYVYIYTPVLRSVVHQLNPPKGCWDAVQ